MKDASYLSGYVSPILDERMQTLQTKRSVTRAKKGEFAIAAVLAAIVIAVMAVIGLVIIFGVANGAGNTGQLNSAQSSVVSAQSNNVAAIVIVVVVFAAAVTLLMLSRKR
jgi:hypothetical protein